MSLRPGGCRAVALHEPSFPPAVEDCRPTAGRRDVWALSAQRRILASSHRSDQNPPRSDTDVAASNEESHMGAGATPAGWYPDVERPGGERYWDGSLWTDQRRSAADAGGGATSAGPESEPPSFGQEPPTYGQEPPAYGQQPPAFGQQPPAYGTPPAAAYGQPQPAYGSPAGYTPYGAQGTVYPKTTVPGWALGLSIAGLVLSICCIGFLLSIPGTIMGWTSMKAIDRGEKDPNQRGVAKAAFIVGLVGLVIAVGWIILVVINGTLTTT